MGQWNIPLQDRRAEWVCKVIQAPGWRNLAQAQADLDRVMESLSEACPRLTAGLADPYSSQKEGWSAMWADSVDVGTIRSAGPSQSS
jgi:hypothetical protein